MVFVQDDPVPYPHFFSLDFGSSHDPAGLGLEGRPRGYATEASGLRGAVASPGFGVRGGG